MHRPVPRRVGTLQGLKTAAGLVVVRHSSGAAGTGHGMPRAPGPGRPGALSFWIFASLADQVGARLSPTEKRMSFWREEPPSLSKEEM
jgi:hypothetical protein